MCRKRRRGGIAAGVAATVLLASTQLCAAEAPAASAVSFYIESQPLVKALNQWAIQAGLQVVWPAGNTEAYSNSTPVQGTLEPMEALSVLLEGTGLTFSVVSEGRTVAIRDREQSVRLRGTANRGGTNAGNPRFLRIASAEESLHETSSAGVQQDGYARLTAGKDQGNSDTLLEVVVTGTHIRGAQSEASPLMSYSRKDIDRTGVSTIEQFMRTVPQNFAVVDGSTARGSLTEDARNNTHFGSAVNLRGLGPGATLTLLDGHRLAAAGTAGSFVDVSMIPLSAIERVDVLTDGASAIYGSDAVAGVVNFILRRDFEGAETSLRYGDSTDGGASERNLSQLVGTSWDQGNAMLVLDYADQGLLRESERDFAPDAGNVSPDFTLLPSQERRSGLLAARQSVSPSLDVFANVLYSKRDYVHDQVGLFTTTHSTGSVDQYGGVLGGTFALSPRWSMDLAGNISRLKQEDHALTSDVSQHTSEDSRVQSVEIRSDGPLFSTPAGDVLISIGGSLRKESLDVAVEGTTVSTSDDRNVTSAFAELNVPLVGEKTRLPLVERIVLSLAGRYDDYNDFGSATVPKLGLSVFPTSSFKLRGTISRAFRAPTLFSLNETPSYVLLSVPDSGSASGEIHTIFNLTSGNTELKAERSTSKTIGFDLTPASMPSFRLSFTYFTIDFRDRISTPPLNGDFFSVYSQPALGPYIDRAPDPAEVARIASQPAPFFFNFGGADFSGIDPALTNAFFDNRPQNIASTKESGLELSTSAGWQLQPGRLEVFLNGEKLLTRDYESAAGIPEVSLLDRTFNPMDLRLRGGATFQRNSLSTSISLNYASGYVNDLVTPAEQVSSWLTADAQLNYELAADSYGALSGLALSLSVMNLTNKSPPFVSYPETLSTFGYDPSNATPRGRFVAFQVRKRW